MFYGIIIRMFWEQGQPHHRPHIHAVYQGQKAVFSLPEGELLDGELPRRQTNIVQTWISLHEDELLANWTLALENEPLFRIDPLK